MDKYPYEFFKYEVFQGEGIAVVTLNNPDQKNVAPFWCEGQLNEIIDRWERDDNVKVVVIRGAGDNFSAGHDFGGYLDFYGVKGKAADSGKKPRAVNRHSLLNQRFQMNSKRRLFNSLKPTIAEIRGLCIEWANVFQACCDISIAADDAQIGSLGQTAGIAGITQLRLFVFLIGYKRAREMAITGRTWTGRDASLIGLINRSVPPERLSEEVWEEARRIALLPVDGIVTGKAYSEMVLESMGLDATFSESYNAYVAGLHISFEEEEFSFIRAVRKSGTSSAIAQRKARYDGVGGFGAQANKPIVGDGAIAETPKRRGK